MKTNLEFEYFDFSPRKDFEERANKILFDLKKRIPFDCECEARCTYFANKFFFQITFKGGDLVLSAQSILDPTKEDVSERGWQMKAIDSMATHLYSQLQKVRNSPAALKAA